MLAVHWVPCAPNPPSSHHHYRAPQDLLLILKCVLAPTHHVVFTCTSLSADTHPILLLRIAYRADPKINIWVTATVLSNLIHLLGYSMPLPKSRMSCEVGEGSCLLPEPQLPRNT